jgi:hypothetical protein
MADGVSLWPVIVGGLLTIAGAIVAGGLTLVLKLLESNNEKKKRRTDKFQELVEAVYEHDHWVNKKRNIVVHGEGGNIDVSPIAKIEAISAVYFPKFGNAIDELILATLAFEKWMGEAAQRRVGRDVAHINDGFNEVLRPYLEKRNALRRELRKFAADEFQ